ncbi:hypothetical protein Tco_0862240, partial [Tanacetum coccineum]
SFNHESHVRASAQSISQAHLPSYLAVHPPDSMQFHNSSDYLGLRGILLAIANNGQIITSENQHVRWTTPLGLPMVTTSLQLLTLQRETENVRVESEMDKLAMEEAGFRNCVSGTGGYTSSISPEIPVS